MYTTALKLSSRRQSRRRKEREPRGKVPSTPPVSPEETALRERVAELERDADPLTKQNAIEAYYDTFDAARAEGHTPTEAAILAYRARIAVLEGTGPADAAAPPPLDSARLAEARAAADAHLAALAPIAYGVLLDAAGRQVELRAYRDHLMAEAPLSLRLAAFDRLLVARFPGARITHGMTADSRLAEIALDGDPAAAITLQEAALWDALNGFAPTGADDLDAEFGKDRAACALDLAR